jgi:hypothetical protein
MGQIQAQYDRTKAATTALIDLMEKNFLLLARHHNADKAKVEAFLEAIRVDFRMVDADYTARGYGGWKAGLRSVDQARREHFNRKNTERQAQLKQERESFIYQDGNGGYYRIKEDETYDAEGKLTVTQRRITMTHDQVVALQAKQARSIL